MAAAAVEARGVSKRYRIGEEFESFGTLRERLSPSSRRRAERPSSQPGEVWPVRDVSFTAEAGEAVGIIGANGSGKTTLLKLLARITDPTIGLTRTRGRVAAILEIGTGFHLELTGAENVLLNGAVLGMSRADMRSRYDRIVEFAGVERFLDTALKRYSSGMRMRLAFAIAAHVDPDILLVDEVLAVGDAQFQRQCLDKMSELADSGRTVLFASHDHAALIRLCSRALWLHDGRLRADGPAAAVVSEYIPTGVRAGSRVELVVRREGVPAAHSVALVGNHGGAVGAVKRGEPVRLSIELVVPALDPGLDLSVVIMSRSGVRVIDEAWQDQPGSTLIKAGRSLVTFTMPGILAPGEYVVGIWVGNDSHDFQYEEALQFEVLPQSGDRPAEHRGRVMQPQVDWHLDGA